MKISNNGWIAQQNNTLQILTFNWDHSSEGDWYFQIVFFNYLICFENDTDF